MRLLSAIDPVKSLGAMAEIGVSEIVLGKTMEPARVEQLVALERVTGRAPDPLLRLAALLGGEANADALQERLRLSRDQAGTLRDLVGGHVQAIPNRRMIERSVLDRGNEAVANTLLLSWVLSGEGPGHRCWRSALEIARDWEAPEFPLKGADLVASGMSPGPQVGKALDKAKEAWIESGYTLRTHDLLALL